MRSALAALLAAQRHSSGYPACTPDMLAPLLRLCNTLQEVRGRGLQAGHVLLWCSALPRGGQLRSSADSAAV